MKLSSILEKQSKKTNKNLCGSNMIFLFLFSILCLTALDFFSHPTKLVPHGGNKKKNQWLVSPLQCTDVHPFTLLY